MDLIIKTHKYIKVEDENFNIEIPENTIYLFETGIRRSIRIVPIYTTWNKENYNKDEEIHTLEVTCVYLSFELVIEKFKISISNIESIWNSKNSDKNEKSILEVLYYKSADNRSKEQFENDLNNAIRQLN